jgi:hypothetical protein
MAIAEVTVNDSTITVSVAGLELLAPYLTAAAASATAAAASATAADASEAGAASSAGTATASATAAQVAYAAVLAAIAAGAVSGPYATKAAADAAALAGTLAANAYAYVIIDETQGSAPTIRQRVSTATTTTFVAALGGLAASFTTTVPVSPGTAFGKTILTMPAAASGMLSDLPRNDAVNNSIYTTFNKLSNGPTGEVNYWNSVTQFCSNSESSATPLNTAMPAARFAIESKFYQNACFATELHIAQTQGASESYAELRAFSAFIPHLRSDWTTKSITSLQGSRILIYDGAGNVPFQMNFRSTDGAGNLSFLGTGADNVRLLFDKNNHAPLAMKNAAGSADINLPFYDNRDVLRLGGSSYQTGSAPAAGVNTGTGYSREYLELGARAGAGFEYALINNAITGNLYGYHIDGVSVSGKYYFSRAWNQHATGKLLDKREAAGDIFWSAGDNGGGNDVNFGRRASDAAFVIALGASEAFTNPAIEIANATRYVNLPAGRLNISGTKVLGTQGAAIANATDAASAITQLNLLLAAARTHGLIAT